MTSKQYEFFISEVVVQELEATPGQKRLLLLQQIQNLPILPIGIEAIELAKEYIMRGILPKGSVGDARHIAVATLNRMDGLVSWNFGHLVNVRRIKAIHQLHQRLNLPILEIITPEEVIREK